MYPVKDMARARRFYEQGLGLEPGAEHVGGKWVEYYPENGCFALSSMAETLQPSTKAGAIAFEVDDPDGVVASLPHGGRLRPGGELGHRPQEGRSAVK